jgi:hypothetical protein
MAARPTFRLFRTPPKLEDAPWTCMIRADRPKAAMGVDD